MRRGFLILGLALLAGCAGFFLTSRQASVGNDDVARTSAAVPALQWLREEFDLTDEQWAKVSELHRAYLPTCESLCEKIIASREKVAGLVREGTAVSPELAAALREHSLLLAECQTAMLGHLYETAAALPPEQAARYLEEMTPHVLTMTADHASGSPLH
ncbi:MAG: periplasmic heavy metal sensor [Verrucomicrobiaceae bacterium]|nr:periplasmic heavy metal sensor [Verrucomicrobiaceae bacterium]